MGLKKIKVSQLPLTSIFRGFKSLGIDKDNKSSAIDLEAVFNGNKSDAVDSDSSDILATSKAVKTLNDAKASKDIATTSAKGLMSSDDKSKLDELEEHPSSHSAEMIDETTDRQFCSQAEKNSWNDGGAMSANEILTALKTVDGSGSGLDADTVDGMHGVYLRGQNYGSSGSDPNTTIYPNILSNHANSPSTSYYWHIETRFYTIISSTANRAQTAVQYNSGTNMYVRKCYSNTWSAWRKVIFSDAAVFSTEIQINNSSTKIQEGSGNTIRLRTNSGYADIGPQNTSHCHIYTDRADFYFNKLIQATDFQTTSDRRFKKRVKAIRNGLSKVMQLKPVTFYWNNKSKKVDRYSKGRDIGFIAQDVEPIMPEVVNTDIDGNKSISYMKMSAINTAAIQELTQELRSEVQDLKEQLHFALMEIKTLKDGSTNK